MTQSPNVRDALAAAARRLDSRADAELLLMHALGVERAWLFAHALDAMTTQAVREMQALVERRAAGEPVAYILGRQGFWSLDLEVSPATLIPRPDTELLVEQALERLPARAPCSVVDLGTGSGAVALAIAHERPEAQVLATDHSVQALEVARRNAQRLGLDRVEFVQGSWCAPLQGRKFNLIVSNPPYIESGDTHLDRGDLRFEPRSALASGADGLQAIADISRQAGRHLADGGWLLLEHGWKQGEKVRRILQANDFREVFTAVDLESRERVTGGMKGRVI